MKKKLLTFILTLALWFVFTRRVNIQVFLLGTIICFTISHIWADNLFILVKTNSERKEFFFQIYYILLVVIAYIYDVFLSAVRVSRHAFEIKPSFSPRIVIIKLSLKNINSIAIFINFITLTEGALAMDFDIVNRNYFIHWININSDDEAEVKKILISKHENLIDKIFD